MSRYGLKMGKRKDREFFTCQTNQIFINILNQQINSPDPKANSTNPSEMCF